MGFSITESRTSPTPSTKLTAVVIRKLKTPTRAAMSTTGPTMGAAKYQAAKPAITPVSATQPQDSDTAELARQPEASSSPERYASSSASSASDVCSSALKLSIASRVTEQLAH